MLFLETKRSSYWIDNYMKLDDYSFELHKKRVHK